MNFGGGTLQYAPGNTYDITARTVTMGPAGGTIDTGGNNVTLAGGLVGPGGLTKAGPGMLVLAGANGYAGTTAVSAGTLAYGGSGNILPGTVNVGPSPGNGGTLLFQGGSVVSFTATGDGNFNVAYGAMVAVQPGAAVTLAGDLKLGALNWGSSGNLVQSGGTLTINDSSSGRPLTIGEDPNETSTYSISGGVLNVPNGTTYVAWDGNAVLSISGGTANLRQIQIGCGDGWSNAARRLVGQRRPLSRAGGHRRSGRRESRRRHAGGLRRLVVFRADGPQQYGDHRHQWQRHHPFRTAFRFRRPHQGQRRPAHAQRLEHL